MSSTHRKQAAPTSTRRWFAIASVCSCTRRTSCRAYSSASISCSTPSRTSVSSCRIRATPTCRRRCRATRATRRSIRTCSLTSGRASAFCASTDQTGARGGGVGVCAQVMGWMQPGPTSCQRVGAVDQMVGESCIFAVCLTCSLVICDDLCMRCICSYERVSGTCIGGGTFWGLCRLLTACRDFDEAMELSQTGDPSKCDMLVGDIYGMPYRQLIATLR